MDVIGGGALFLLAADTDYFTLVQVEMRFSFQNNCKDEISTFIQMK